MHIKRAWYVWEVGGSVPYIQAYPTYMHAVGWVPLKVSAILLLEAQLFARAGWWGLGMVEANRDNCLFFIRLGASGKLTRQLTWEGASKP